MSWKWFSVKTLYRNEVFGKPIAIDENYDESVTLVEERIVIFKARNHEEAIKKAEKDALEYIKETHINPYGQKVKTRYLKAFDSYEIFEDLNNSLKSGIEFFSNTELVDVKDTDDNIIDWRFGNKHPYSEKNRKKFLNREFSGIVGDIVEHRKIIN